MRVVVEVEEEEEESRALTSFCFQLFCVEFAVSLRRLSMSSVALSGGRGWWRSVGEAGPLELALDITSMFGGGRGCTN